jgi:ABC-type dipeptide/oligopeptide/nickel transport system permease subunit
MSMSTSDLLGSSDDASEVIEAAAVEGRTPWQLAWLRLKRDKVAMGSLIFIVILILVAIFAPVLTALIGHGPNTQYPNTGLTSYGAPVGPSRTFLLGTDDLGRDVLSRVIYGSRISLEVGIGATLLGLIVGLVVGVMAGFYGGRVDIVLARIMDLLLSFPALLLALALVARFGNHLWVELFVLGFFSWPAIGRLVRGQVFALKEREFVEAARSVGSGNFRIMFLEIVPNLLALSIIYATLLIPANIVAEAVFSYLGLGVLPPEASWGNMISETQNGNLYTIAWWFLVFPSVALFLTTLSFNLVGDGLRDALDPRAGRSMLGR